MIILHRRRKDPEADKIEEKLDDLVLAYQVETNPNYTDMFIEDGDQKIKDSEKIESWFQKLESELKWQRSLSGDACFMDPDTGEIC